MAADNPWRGAADGHALNEEDEDWRGDENYDDPVEEGTPYVPPGNENDGKHRTT